MSVQWRYTGYSFWNFLLSNWQKYKEQNFGEVSPTAGFNKQAPDMSQVFTGSRDEASYFSYSSSFSYSNYCAMRACYPQGGICMAFVFSVPICRNIQSSVTHLGFWIDRYLLYSLLRISITMTVLFPQKVQKFNIMNTKKLQNLFCFLLRN